MSKIELADYFTRTEAMPLKVMPTVWQEPDLAAVEAARRPVDVLFQSPPCFGFSRPLRGAAVGAK